MVRLLFVILLILCGVDSFSQQHSVAIGLYGGFTVPYTLDGGFDSDPRYESRYRLKPQTIGVAFSMDYENVGFQISPGIYTIGQDYFVVNSSGGHVGERNLDLKYAMLPFAFKVHLIDLAFFRVSALASVSGAFLYDAQDFLRHDDARLRFPSETYPALEALPGYSVEYYGVVSPRTSMLISSKEDYKPIQLFGGLGLSSDWNVTEQWRITFDFRFNYGVFDSRTDAYLSRIKRYESIYDMPGSRNEMFAHFSIGVSRYLDFDKGDRDRQKNLKGSKKKFEPRKQVKIKPSRNRVKLK